MTLTQALLVITTTVCLDQLGVIHTLQEEIDEDETDQ